MTTSSSEAPQMQAEWDKIAASSEFQSLIRAKIRYIVPATCFFLVYYFLLPVLVGYAPRMMSMPVLGPLNGAYLFALSQFLMSWIVMLLYLRAAARFDKQAAHIVQQHIQRDLATSGNRAK